MTFASRYRAERARSTGAIIRVVLGVTLTLGLLAGRAEAAPSSTSTRAVAADLCSTARGVATDIVRGTSVTSLGATPATLKATYLKLQAAEPALLSSASGAQKTELTQVFGFLNLLIADLKKANWKAAGLAGQIGPLEAQSLKTKKPLQALEKYFTQTCKIKM